MNSGTASPLRTIQFGLARADAEALQAVLREGGFRPEEREVEASESALGFGWAELMVLSVPLAEIAANTMHVHALAHVVSQFISSRKRKLRIRYERGGGFEIEADATPKEIEPILERLMDAERGMVWILPAPRGR
jgi:hypothetical protein